MLYPKDEKITSLHFFFWKWNNIPISNSSENNFVLYKINESMLYKTNE